MTETQPISDARFTQLVQMGTDHKHSLPEIRELVGEVIRLRDANTELVNQLRDVDADCNNTHLDIGRLFRRLRVDGE